MEDSTTQNLDPNRPDVELLALISPFGDGWQGTLLELDIAASATGLNVLIAEFRHAIIVLYEIARDLGQTTFADTKPAPAEYADRYLDGSATGTWTILLPHDVGDTLLVALGRRGATWRDERLVEVRVRRVGSAALPRVPGAAENILEALEKGPDVD